MVIAKKEKKLGALGDKQQFRTFDRCSQDQWDKICKKTRSDPSTQYFIYALRKTSRSKHVGFLNFKCNKALYF